jgi:hypothetical protein
MSTSEFGLKIESEVSLVIVHRLKRSRSHDDASWRLVKDFLEGKAGCETHELESRFEFVVAHYLVADCNLVVINSLVVPWFTLLLANLHILVEFVNPLDSFGPFLHVVEPQIMDVGFILCLLDQLRDNFDLFLDSFHAVFFSSLACFVSVYQIELKSWVE